MENRRKPAPPAATLDINCDCKEYVLDYLAHSFPVQLYEPFSDGEGNVSSRPVYRDGQPVLCRAAVQRRDQLIERLAALPPVPGALDQILHHFGTDKIAEITGRSRRIVKKIDEGGDVRFAVENRPGSANVAEIHAFMDDDKQGAVFSEAGGTGTSLHASLVHRNQRPREHYTHEAGWKADNAIQGFGRTNRTHQAQPPRYWLVTTNVKAQKRFTSTIARRLDSLGAITRGQRQTGGQNMFRPEDNLESQYGRDALRQLYVLIYRGMITGCSLGRFEAATGLRLTDSQTGGLREDLPGITTFLNRMLALTIELQDSLFSAFEDLLIRRIEGAIASGIYEVGLETLRAESFTVVDQRTIYTHPGTGAETRLVTIARKRRAEIVALADALDRGRERGARLLVNARSGRAAVQVRARSMLLDDGGVEERIRLVRPGESQPLPLAALTGSHWEPADTAAFSAAWNAEVAEIQPFEMDSFHLVTGLLLPIWKRLPYESTRVYRLQTDAGERLIGRRVSPAWVAATLGGEAPTLTVEQAWPMLLAGNVTLHLAEGQMLSRVRSMSAPRIELTGFNDLGVERLKAMGLISEIVSWKLRLFVPTGADGPNVLARLMERFPLQRVAERPAANAA